MLTTEAIDLGNTLGWLLTLAWLLPLAGFAVEIFGGFWGSRKSKLAAYMAVACIGGAFVLSATALGLWGTTTHWGVLKGHDSHGASHGATHASTPASSHGGEASHATPAHADEQL